MSEVGYQRNQLERGCFYATEQVLMEEDGSFEEALGKQVWKAHRAAFGELGESVDQGRSWAIQGVRVTVSIDVEATDS